MKKKIILMFLIICLFLTGCSLGNDYSKPYDAINAKDWADHWTGPCEQISMIRTDKNEKGEYEEIYTMRDLEYGFTYNIKVTYTRYSTGLKPSYSYADFDSQYIKAFVDNTDFSELDEYNFKIIVDDSHDRYIDKSGQITFESPTTNYMIDQNENLIFEFLYEKLTKFDTRRHFTRTIYSPQLFIYVRYPTTKEYQEAYGVYYKSYTRVYSYRSNIDKYK